MPTGEIGKVCTRCYVLNGIIQDKGFIWGMFVASSMKAATHLGPDFLKNLEIYKNTRFENIENVINFTQRLIKEHSEEILNMKDLEYSSPSWTRSILVNDQAIKGQRQKYVRSMCWTEEVKWKGSGCFRLTKMQWESMEKQLNSSGKFSQDVHHCLFLPRSRRTE